MKKSPEQLVIDIQEACKELGWYIGMDESSELITGLIIGQQAYVEEIIEQLPNIDNYSIYANEQIEIDNKGLH